ncbi:hypothetical protein Q675_00995 [Labrenzia sp. C1B70]|nr:hypothetical protein Q675_00995 [Labrenzia sp. C1B70]
MFALLSLNLVGLLLITFDNGVFKADRQGARDNFLRV